MKRRFCFAVVIWLLFGVAVLSNASEKATKKECISKTNEAIDMIGAKGLKATLNIINDKTGPFVWKDSYVFAIDNESAKMLAHPFVPPKMIGKSFRSITDKQGKAYFQEFLDVANHDGQGWVDYVYPNPQGVMSKKVAYVLKVPDEDIILIAGIYAGSTATDRPSTLEGKRAALILCFNGFDDNEYHGLKNAFDRLAMPYVVYSSKIGIAEGMHGSKLQTEHRIAEFNAEEVDVVVFVGGRGLEEYLNNPKIHNIAQEMLSKGKILAANYWAPAILANAGVLVGKRATITPIEAETLKKHGANYIDEILVIDGNVITGNGSAAAELYADLVAAKILIDAFQ